MRWSTLVTLIISCLLLGAFAAPASGLARRDEIANTDGNQDGNQNANTATAENNASEALTTATQTDASITATEASTTAEATATGTHAVTTGATNATTTTSAPSATSTVPSLDGTTSSSSSDGADSQRPTYNGGLPITPKITPAFGVGGFILMALGAVLAFIGVRKQWVQIFLATGFLTALGVTVLIIYVMSPPVSNAVQGGYLVAVFFTGAVFGGLSLVFREICEGLGCLLGGFCLSMWFLALRPGGLLTESGPKAGMIIAFTVGFYSLSFSHYTRPYGLIGCTSFSGATALVLGIDCYSRAGLKEFWLYIWGLNKNVFPLRTDTYPVTRGIRVELAATIIVGILGVISQVRLWNVIKERRAKEEDIRKEQTRKIEEEDAEAGRRLEEKNIQERAEWELIYGNGKGADVKTASISETAVGDSRRGSDGFTSSDNEKDGDIELKEVHSPDSSGSASGSEKNGGENGNRELEAVPEESAEHDHANGDKEYGPETDPKGRRPATPVTHALGVARDDASENGAMVGSEVGSPRNTRFSGRDMTNRASMLSQEAVIVHDDANSSVQGVADDLHETSVGCPSVASDVQNPVEITEREIEPSEKSLEKEPQAAGVEVKSNVDSQAAQSEKPNVDESATIKQVAKDVSEEASVTPTAPQATSAENSSTDKPVAKDALESSEEPRSPETSVTDVAAEAVPAAAAAVAAGKTQEAKVEPTLQPLPLTDAKAESAKDNNESRPRTAGTSKPESIQEPIPEPVPEPVPEPKIEPPKVEPKVEVIKRLDATTVKALPEQTSRVIHSYRTNEWAKHLADADTPEWEPIVFDPEPELPELEEHHEAPAIVDVNSLLQTPLTAQPAPIVNRPEPQEIDQHQAAYISSMPSPEIPRSKTRTGAHGLTTKAMPPPLVRNESSAAIPMMRSSSGPTSPTQEQGLTSSRNASTPLLTITTPNEPKETEPSPRWSGPPPLLAVREDMVRNRMSSTSNRFDPWSSRNQSRQSLPDMSPIASPISPISPISPLSAPQERDEEYHTPHDEDNIPLSKRRAMLQRQTMQSPSAASLHSLEGHSPVQSPPSPSGDVNRSASRMAAWRQSVREEITQKRDVLHSPPISPVSPDKRNTWGSVQQMREASSTQLGNAIAEGMQRGSMTDLHRQAMRRMQASANRQL
ncbi:hypothetical protein N7541_006450 [Penicillium brevicompactum]|uniref:TM7S3/TM198-like domain-containing protein n=1 Tax=Penicillium brevicompactum TaxID=5074 RepID=A0A9W9R5F5_PENBR|nr:hypothetical protein N7541_006450 [Penicillium brevicompactum]